MKHPTLYTKDEHGNVRIWYMETEGHLYRTVSGVEGGSMVKSGWVTARAKNVGRANASTPEEQALFEVESNYTKKKERKYSEHREDATTTNILVPMLANSWKDLKPDKRLTLVKSCWAQPKLDGIRCLVGKDFMLSRNGKPIVSSPHILRSLSSVFERYPKYILDGELYNHDFHDDFNTISSLVGQKKPTSEDHKRSEELVQFHVYDVAYTPWKFEERSDWIFNQNFPECVKVVNTDYINSLDRLNEVYAQYLELNYEGQMIRLDDYYEYKRSKNLIKRKEFVDAEYPVVEIKPGKGHWSECAKSVVCLNRDKTTFSAGIKGSMEFTKSLLLKAHNGQAPKTCTIRSPNLTPDGVPRFGIAVAFYDGKRDM